MSRTDMPNVIAECWQVLSEYIPHKDTRNAAEHLVSYFQSILTRKEMLELTDQDEDLMSAYNEVIEPEEPEEEEAFEE